MKILGIIPARGGSKGVPRKNIRKLAGRPLIEYTLDACRDAVSLTGFTISTEDDEISKVSQAYGAHVTHRPAELAQDHTPSLPVIQHATIEYEKEFGIEFDVICLLQPTTPLRRADDIDKAVKQLTEADTDSLVSVCQIPDKFHPNWAFQSNEQGQLVRVVRSEKLEPRRQGLSPAYYRDGSIYLVRRNVLLDGNSLYGDSISPFINDSQIALNIDTADDWALAEQLFSSRENS